MVLRLALICQGPTSATRTAAFPADDPLDDVGLARVQASSFRRSPSALCWRSPAQAARQTAAALELAAEITPALRDCDYGAWSGRSLDDVQASDPAGVAQWLSDPASHPHGGESLLALTERVAAWLAAQPDAGQVVAVTHASVVRAAIVAALQAPATAFWRIDVAPLSVARLRRSAGRWTLVSAGVRLARRPGSQGAAIGSG